MSKSQRNSFFFFLLILLFGFFGAEIGSVIYYYDQLAKGILGSAIFYLTWRFYIYPKPNSNQFAGLDVELPRDLKYVVLSSLFGIIGYLSFAYISEAIFYLLSIPSRVRW